MKLSNRYFVSPIIWGAVFLGACGDSGDDGTEDGSADGIGGTGQGASSGGAGEVGAGGASGASSGTGGAGSGGAGGSGQGASMSTGGEGSFGAGGEASVGGAGGTATAAGGQGSGGVEAGDCDDFVPALSVEFLSETSIANLGIPFDTDGDDLAGPTNWASQYGKAPEIVPFSTGDALDVLFQDQASDEFAYVVHIVPTADTFEVRRSYRVGSLGRVMGFTRDDSGNYYVATGVDEDAMVDATFPPNGVHRPDIVRIVKFDEGGCILMESDVDMERGVADPGSDIIVNPMVAASSRLVWGGDRLLLVHGNNTEPDPDLDGTRHQKAMSTHLNAMDGTVTRTSTMWVSHSFDQRVHYDGTGFVELHLGDAYPRFVALGHYNDAGGDGAYAAYKIKGETGANNTYTRLGGMVQTSDATFGTMVLFATERSTDAGSDMVSGTRDVALVRVQSDFMNAETNSSIVDEGGSVISQIVMSAGESVTNYVHWLTDLGENIHAERPRITALEGGSYLVLFEQWSTSGRDTFEGTFALTIDSTGAVLSGPTEVPGEHHLGRGDDIVTLGGRAIYVTGGDGALHLNLVAGDLTVERISLP